MRPADRLRLAASLAALAAAAIALTGWRWSAEIPPGRWWAAALAPDLDSVQDLVFHFSALPRFCTALLAGAALGLAGTLFQHVLRNALASPTTLGVEAGAQLALTVAAIAAPALLGTGREAVTLAGAGLAMGAVFGVAAAGGFSSMSLVLAGLTTGLFCGALTIALRLLNHEFVAVLFLWGAGPLDQQDWSAPAFLLPRLAGLALATLVSYRALAVLGLDDGSARALGLPLGLVRGAGIALALVATATVTSAVGVIGFLGLAAPQIARFSGARTFGARLLAGPAVGALLLAAVDALVGLAEGAGVASLPTGAATGLLGGPLLIWLLPRLRLSAPPVLGERPAIAILRRPGRRLALLALLLAAAVLAALAIGRTGSGTPLAGWVVAGPAELATLAPWRVPRTLCAALAGAMLACAGVLLQRLTGNALASPEVLGVGTGVAGGLIAAMVILGTPGHLAQAGAGAAGAAAILAAMLAVGRRTRFTPETILLTGLSLSALLDAFVVAFLSLGDQRAGLLLSWLAGSTYRADAGTAAFLGGAALLLLPAALLLRRPLDILPLGEDGARSLGLALVPLRVGIVALAASLTAAATLATGPLTFVGLMAPHLARSLGLRHAATQIAAACLCGATLMTLADAIARTAIAPRQLPAGIVAALIGLPYLIVQLGRRRA